MTSVPLTHQDYSVGWVCALKEELAVAIVMLEKEHPDLPIPESDRNAYTLGSIGDHNIAIAALPEGDIGNNPAATVATRMTCTFPSIKFWLMVGIGGGVPPNVRLGDIVVGTPVYNLPGVVQWDSGIIEGEKYRRIGTLDKAPEVLRAAITKLRARHEIRRAHTGILSILEDLRRKEPDFVLRYGKSKDLKDTLFETNNDHVVIEGQEVKDTCQDRSREKIMQREARRAELEIHYGVIASGNSVIKNGRQRDQIDKELLEGHTLCFEMEAAGVTNNHPCLCIRGICDYSDTHKNYDWQKHAALVAAAFAKELLQVVAPSQVNLMPPAAKVLDEVSKVKHTIKCNLEATQKIDTDFALSRLPFAKDAAFNALSDESEPRCHPETRIALLEEIENWALKSENRCIFWLKGMAGTGKSTVSRTVCQKYRHGTTAVDITSHCQLGASFFFKRGEGDRGNASKFFSTLAFQLAQDIPGLRPHLRKALDADPTIFTKAMKEQFEKLILEPLSELSTSLTTLIVIDALDECDDEDHIAKIVHLLARVQVVTSVKLRIMITSRPELPVEISFVKIPDEHRPFILHDIPLPTITHDIGVFLKDELPKIRDDYNLFPASGKSISPDWPTERNMDDLTRMAVPLFIFAATMCRFMAERWDPDPVGKLIKILQYQSAGSLTQLGRAYLPVLHQMLKGAATATDRENRLREFRDIIGSIVILFEPLSRISLANLLCAPTDIVDRRLHVLHSVLRIPTNPRLPVRVFHLSFRDFLVGAEHKTEFSIDETETHSKIAFQCLQLLMRTPCLKRDICSLRKPGFLRVNIDIPLLQEYLPAEVQHACCYWTHHLEGGNHRICDQDEIHNLLNQRFLYWIEALAIIGKLKDSLSMIARLQRLLEVRQSFRHRLALANSAKPKKSSVLDGFLNDAKHFVLMNREVLDIAPLQLYSSALTFAPATSIIRKMFLEHIPDSIVILPTVQESWSAMLYALEGHTGRINSLQFSRNGKLLASGSADGKIKLWDLASGNLQQTLEGHSGEVGWVSFLPDGKQLTSGADEGIQQWDIASGILLQSYKGHLDPFLYKAFSPDGKQRVSMSLADHYVELRDTASGVQLQRFKKDSIDSQEFAFSSDGKQLASGSLIDIELWDTISGVLLQIFEGHTAPVTSLTFSPDGNQLASGSWKSIKLWDTTSGVLLQIFEGHTDDVTSLAFSPDGKQLASGSADKAISMWDIAPGTLLESDEVAGHDPHCIVSMTFSPNGKQLASRSSDSQIKLWDGASGALLQIHVGGSMAFSPDGKQLAVGGSKILSIFGKQLTLGDCSNIKLWDTVSGALLQDFEGHPNSFMITWLVFSLDGKWLASESYEKTIKMWDAASGALLQNLESHSVLDMLAPFSPDSKQLASASHDNAIKIWDAASGALLQNLQGHSDQILSAAFSSNGKKLASGSHDKTIRLWNARTGDHLRTLQVHSGSVKAIAFSPDGKQLASGSHDKTVKLWDAASGWVQQTFDTGETISWLSFRKDNAYLETNKGLIRIQRSQADIYPLQTQPTKCYFLKNNWITRDTEPFLWLPFEYRATASDWRNGVLAFGNEFDRITLFRSPFESN
ncbi:MAG: hypothetical protein M1822_006871 [Bathelium mastoideum]|nr:MAG: hypothetical protein M1822_006871 [Bathelium mastoideum]